MILDYEGLPRDNGSTDFMDSARLAGLLALFDNPKFDKNLLIKYVQYNSEGVMVAMRHPREYPANNWKNFTRDQLMCFAAGMYQAGYLGTVRKLYYAARDREYRAQNTEKDLNGTTKKFPDGPDLLTPSCMGHLRRCSGIRTTRIQNAWLIMDIVYHSIFARMEEPNQLIAMCVIAGPKYIGLFKKLNSKWRDGIRDYWSGWRREPVFAEQMISSIEQM